ncbi:MerR family transcriptional regulator [Phytoactinopolyspora halotolerans]|uniref:MerR family transcriptional regulator n=1 Tax=Phytoactinopolyspora halotolerans TaxID=1981512 RepID=A0A6L9S753_9ACTN|nr:MerR family transcriptional regulator [Phytoactinopolyspora halotolerans]NEE00803.1 MerR family transcriptional regulator [Phytoactinopolyspora halotolerans]
MRIGEVARRSGVSVRALRYYEEQGLLTSDRTPGGHREYAADAVDRVRFYQQLYAAGLPSRRIAELLPCIDTGTTTAEQRAMLDAERARLQGRIAELTDALARLDELVAAAEARPA